MNGRGNVAQKSFSADAGAVLFLEVPTKALDSFSVCRRLSCHGLGKEGRAGSILTEFSFYGMKGSKCRARHFRIVRCAHNTRQ